jgi:hypothetical protein
LAPAALAALACGKGKPHTPTAMGEDLKRDLQLASVTQNLKISPDEVAPKSHQELAVKPKKAPNGPKVIRTEHPTVKASTIPAQVAEIKSEIPQMQVMASGPSATEAPSSDAPPLARPSAIPATSTYPGAAPIPANGGSGGILGGIFGAVIRGGGVGDDDHCDPRGGMVRRPMGGRPIGNGGVYVPMPMGGMGGGRMIPGRARP